MGCSIGRKEKAGRLVGSETDRIKGRETGRIVPVIGQTASSHTPCLASVSRRALTHPHTLRYNAFRTLFTSWKHDNAQFQVATATAATSTATTTATDNDTDTTLTSSKCTCHAMPCHVSFGRAQKQVHTMHRGQRAERKGQRAEGGAQASNLAGVDAEIENGRAPVARLDTLKRRGRLPSWHPDQP